jgi:hypothetical protein
MIEALELKVAVNEYPGAGADLGGLKPPPPPPPARRHPFTAIGRLSFLAFNYYLHLQINTEKSVT